MALTVADVIERQIKTAESQIKSLQKKVDELKKLVPVDDRQVVIPNGPVVHKAGK